MLKTLLILSAAIPSYVCAQTLQLRKDPIDKVINAMTLDEKLDLLVGSGGNVNTDAFVTIGNSAVTVPAAAGQVNAIPRLDIPATVMTDGPAGLCIQHTREKSI